MGELLNGMSCAILYTQLNAELVALKAFCSLLVMFVMWSWARWAVWVTLVV
jgi:hypothetical protein